MKMVLLRNKKSKEISSVTSVTNAIKPTYTIFDEVESVVEFTKVKFKVDGYVFECKGHFTYKDIQYGISKIIQLSY